MSLISGLVLLYLVLSFVQQNKAMSFSLSFCVSSPAFVSYILPVTQLNMKHRAFYSFGKAVFLAFHGYQDFHSLTSVKAKTQEYIFPYH